MLSRVARWTLVVAVALLWGCTSNSNSSIALAPLQHLYAANANSTNQFLVYSAPLGASSSPLILGAANGLSGGSGFVRVGADGRLYVTSSSVLIFTLPLSASSMPVVAMGGISGPLGLAFDGSGNLFVGGNDSIVKYAPPFSNSETPATIITGLHNPLGVEIDTANNIYVGNCGGTSNDNIQMYSPPYTGPPVTVLTGGCVYGVRLDRAGNLYVAIDENSNNGTQVYHTPLTNGATPAFTIATGNSGDLAFDQFGNMAVINYDTTNGSIDFYPAPIKAGSAKIFSITQGFSNTNISGVFFAP